MCGKRLKTFSALSVLFLLLCFSPFSPSCYADVILTDKEAQEMMEEIQASKTELTELKNELNSAQTELTDVKNISEEQKKSYEKQLNEAGKKEQKLETAVTVTSTTTVLLTILCIVFAIL
jgi:ABC-type transport system involved in cytochrome bd biosynthesis fused ATPase/permease subunit